MGEIELKFIIDESTSRQLWARAKGSKLANGAPRVRTLRSIYLDTPEHALKKAGIAMRLRRDGRRWIQTVKTDAQLHGGLSQVGEFENPAPGGRPSIEAIPDVTVREEIVQQTKGAVLQPVCETIIRRQAGELVLADGTRVELAVDVGEILAAGRSARLREAEIELIDGNVGGLFEVARLLFPDGGLRFSELSKGARGYLLAEEGLADPPLAPRNARQVALHADQTTEQAAREVLRSCVEQVAANMVVVRELDDPEGPHQLRVGLRRLRSAFSVFSPALQGAEMARLSDEARWLGQQVGRLRDLDVVADEIVGREASTHPDEAGLSGLAEELRREAVVARGELRGCLPGARAQVLLLDMVRFVEMRGWLDPSDIGQTERLAVPVPEFARQALQKRWKKVARRAEAFDTLTVEQRHELRKELKKFRYATEFFASLFRPKHVDPFLKRLKKLQAVFGDLNDAATLRTMFTEGHSPAAGDGALQRGIGWVIGASQARGEISWAGARDLWLDLRKADRFWK
ncbi:CYTH and CHAD domain-containing protein [Mesorhizobium sp. L-8-3]|uniref:CYTH and CHAD domain-containing protein n=1 Tax=Mesorhizobium sp. L-8-3 TaxID=2744522 RepID=UPI001929524B|nr:CHAD domain-containing protein [Mesorhizobium sp. L-8-3]BCH26184.1 inorganic triphosphatase [Mesorhizobium sp. L-8-3]